MRRARLPAAGRLALVAALAGMAGCTLSGTQTRVDTVVVGEAARLEADVESGRISIRPGVIGEVRIETTLRAARSTAYQVTQDGDTVRLTAALRPGTRFDGAQPAIDIQVGVPARIDLVVSSTRGGIYVDEVIGELALSTTTGGIQCSDSEGAFALQTHTGSIFCRRMRGSFVISSTLGMVNLLDVQGVFQVTTDGGTVNLEGALEPADHTFRSRSGNLDLRLLGAPDVQVDVASESGVVRCTLDLDQPQTVERGCKGILGSGAGHLIVRTETGMVSIR